MSEFYQNFYEYLKLFSQCHYTYLLPVLQYYFHYFIHY